MLKPLVKFLKALNSNSRPMETGFAIACGILLGLVPGTNAGWYILLIIICLFKIHYPSMLLALAISKIFVPLLDNALHQVGSSILLHPSLESGFTRLYNMPLVPYTNFNSTTFMGGLVIGLVLLFPLALVFSRLIIIYRTYLLQHIKNSRLYKAILKMPLVSGLLKITRKSGLLQNRR